MCLVVRRFRPPPNSFIYFGLPYWIGCVSFNANGFWTLGRKGCWAAVIQQMNYPEARFCSDPLWWNSSFSLRCGESDFLAAVLLRQGSATCKPNAPSEVRGRIDYLGRRCFPGRPMWGFPGAFWGRRVHVVAFRSIFPTLLCSMEILASCFELGWCLMLNRTMGCDPHHEQLVRLML